MKPEIKLNLIRVAYLAFFMFVFYLIWYLFLSIAVLQLVHNFVFSRSNPQLLRASENVNNYFMDVIRFLTFNTDAIPFPFAPWQH